MPSNRMNQDHKENTFVLDSAEKEIIHRAQSGDVAAFRWIYDRYESVLLRTALRMLGARPEAEDAVQNTFIKLFRSIDKFQFRSRFDTWLYRIHMNVCLDLIARRPGMQVTHIQSEPMLAAVQHELRIDLTEAIERLPARMRACFILFAIEELPQAEIAAIMHISIGGVKATIFQAKARLRALLSEKEK
jgi:RNA polymerase sigma-70 factor, ECF subfamily